MHRRSPAAVAVLFAALFVGPAEAHNGTGAAFKGPAGPYTVYAYDGYPVPTGLAYRLVVLDRASGQPAHDVRAAVTARSPQASTPRQRAQTEVMNNVVFYDLPNPFPGDWQVTVQLRGPGGSGVATFAMHGQPPYVPVEPAIGRDGGGGNVALVVGGSAGVLAVVVAGAWWFYRRRRRITKPSGPQPTV